MKQLLFAATLWLLSSSVHAQTTASLKKNVSLQPALNEVIQEYFKNFEGSKGDIISETPSVIIYESKVSLPGALSSVIQQYSLPDTYSWEARMMQTEEFDEAAAKYKQLFRQINNMKLTPAGYEKIQLLGTLDEPDDGRAFASSQFRLETVKDGRKNFILELGMQFEFPEWTVKIFMFEKMPDEEIRPGMPDLR